MVRSQPLPFSPAFDFVWMQASVLNGVECKPGDAVDKTQLDPRRLQALFDLRKIRVAAFEGPPPAYLNLGQGKTEQLAQELATEEGAADAVSDAAVSAETSAADAARADAAAEAPAAKTVERGAKRKPARAKRAA